MIPFQHERIISQRNKTPTEVCILPALLYKMLIFILHTPLSIPSKMSRHPVLHVA